MGGIAPPRSTRARSGSGTLNGASHGNAGAGAGYPVGWGPHQNQAHGSPLDSVPPSPTVASPSPVYLNGGAAAGYGYGAPFAAGQGKRGISVETTAAQVPSSMNPSPVSPVEEAGGMLGVPGQGQGYGQGQRTIGAPAGAQRIREMRSKESMRRGSLGRGGAPAEGGGDGVGRRLSKKLDKRNSRHSSGVEG